MARQITNAKPQDMIKTLSSFKKYIGYHKYALSCVAVLVIISTGINLWGKLCSCFSYHQYRN